MRSLLGKRSKPEVSEEQRQAQELLKQQKRDQLLEKLLPWRLEQKVAMFLNPIKIPIIIIVGVLGSIVEFRMRSIVDTTWHATMWRDGPTCFVHRVHGKLVSDDALKNVSSTLNSALSGVNDYINQSLQNSSRCNRTEEGAQRCVLFDSAKLGLNYSFEKDYCGINDTCELNFYGSDGSEVLVEDEDKVTGLLYHLPFIPYVMVWAIYKLAFLPVHPVDRAANCVSGNPKPPPEPVFKLLTEPNFQTCSGFMSVVVAIGKIIRYSLLPNTLMVPLLTMGRHPKCEEWIFYDFDSIFGFFIYYWAIFELVFVVAMYVVGKTVFKSLCVGTWKYRCYKTYWFMTLFTALFLFIADTIVLFNWRFWEGLLLMLQLAFTFDLRFSFAVDFVRTLATVNIFLDVLQLLILIFSLIAPPLLRKLAPEWYKKEDDHDDAEAERLMMEADSEEDGGRTS